MIEPTQKQVIESLQSALRTLGAEKDDANLSEVSAREECELLRKNNANLKTVMIAAAEEIHKHWQAHCDSEGYGPANLMRRLEEGIPAEYGYTAGAFSELEKDAKTLKELAESGRRAIGDHYAPDDCYATGPLTGNKYLDLVQCPACAFISLFDDYKPIDSNVPGNK